MRDMSNTGSDGDADDDDDDDGDDDDRFWHSEKNTHPQPPYQALAWSYR